MLKKSNFYFFFLIRQIKQAKQKNLKKKLVNNFHIDNNVIDKKKKLIRVLKLRIISINCLKMILFIFILSNANVKKSNN